MNRESSNTGIWRLPGNERSLLERQLHNGSVHGVVKYRGRIWRVNDDSLAQWLEYRWPEAKARYLVIGKKFLFGFCEVKL